MIKFIKQHPWEVGGGAVLLVAFVGLLLWKPWKQKDDPDTVSGSRGANSNSPGSPARSGGGSAPATSGFCKHRDYPLRLGSCHPDVNLLQQMLVTMGADLGKYGPGKNGVDGKFGKVTEAATLKYLKKKTVSKAEMAGLKRVYQQYKG